MIFFRYSKEKKIVFPRQHALSTPFRHVYRAKTDDDDNTIWPKTTSTLGRRRNKRLSVVAGVNGIYRPKQIAGALRVQTNHLRLSSIFIRFFFLPPTARDNGGRAKNKKINLYSELGGGLGGGGSDVTGMVVNRVRDQDRDKDVFHVLPIVWTRRSQRFYNRTPLQVFTATRISAP